MARRLAAWATLMLACAALGVAAAPAAMPAASGGAAVPASPSLTPSPTPTPTPALSPCCATLAASGYVRTPGVPAVLITTAASAPPDRTKRPATLCTCGAGDVGTGADGSPVVDWAGPIRLKNRGGVNTRTGGVVAMVEGERERVGRQAGAAVLGARWRGSRGGGGGGARRGEERGGSAAPRRDPPPSPSSRTPLTPPSPLSLCCSPVHTHRAVQQDPPVRGLPAQSRPKRERDGGPAPPPPPTHPRPGPRRGPPRLPGSGQ